MVRRRIGPRAGERRVSAPIGVLLGASLVALGASCEAVLGDLPAAVDDAGTHGAEGGSKADSTSRSTGTGGGTTRGAPSSTSSRIDEGGSSSLSTSSSRASSGGASGGGGGKSTTGTTGVGGMSSASTTASTASISSTGSTTTASVATSTSTSTATATATTATGGCCDCDGDGHAAMGPCGGDDCDDTDPNAVPGQANYYGVPNRVVGFDWNCDGLIERNPEYDKMLDCTGMQPPCDPMVQGYLTSIPGCGQGGRYGDCEAQGILCVPTVLTQNQIMSCH